MHHLCPQRPEEGIIKSPEAKAPAGCELRTAPSSHRAAVRLNHWAILSVISR